MAKQTFQPNPRLNQIFEDLEQYLSFCVEYGYLFNESNLYDMRVYSWRQFQKFLGGKEPKDQWSEDAKLEINL